MIAFCYLEHDVGPVGRYSSNFVLSLSRRLGFKTQDSGHAVILTTTRLTIHHGRSQCLLRHRLTGRSLSVTTYTFCRLWLSLYNTRTSTFLWRSCMRMFCCSSFFPTPPVRSKHGTEQNYITCSDMNQT